MSLTNIESDVQQVLQHVSKLVDKINHLETVISEQNVKISNLSQLTRDLTGKLDGNQSTPKSQPKKPIGTQVPAQPRPQRQARINATAALNRAALSRKSNSPAMTQTPVVINANSPVQSIPTVPDLKNKSVSETDPEIHQKSTPQPEASILPESPIISDLSQNIDDTQTWNEVRSRKKNRKNIRRSVIKGTGSADSELQSMERVRRIHACFFKAQTTAEVLLRYMNKKNPCANYKVEQLSLKHDYYASFSITLPNDKYDYFMNPSSWPAGVEVSEWFRSGARRGRPAPTSHNASSRP
ncbi:uncharacterized protein LOC125229467 isoform X2 [Leguminivora glycinivorella]|uniref:uncharacterized protein LOC125229467 isoform X1 n=1 Tax=Leguminivora glycinivorella TaxID=1035111 RepID=UPI00200CB912|nr:uncharacterized protein LOC125229467 isoform X1 [Leguminivora glycinivorella]XP_047990271.1 uncharacterized protein LOC125229467 isoform X2 [Leguminivora glycinivorella]